MKLFWFLGLALLTACTLTFSNISTHGTAEDVLDSSPTNDVKSDVQVPVNVTPM